MAYDLHITRAAQWTDSESDPITDAEWKAFVEAAPDFEMVGVAEAPAPDGTLRYENAGLAAWAGHPASRVGDVVWFDFRDGRVVVKNPDQPTIDKMILVAAALDAKVIGDDGESYESPGGVPPTPVRVSFADRVAAWFERWRPRPAPVPMLPPFEVGARVEGLGGVGTVLSIDPQAMHGQGAITVRFDDGRVLTFAMFAHGLTSVRSNEG